MQERQLANELYNVLYSNNHSLILLDGDEFVKVKSTEFNSKNHGREARLSLAMKYARLCKLISGARNNSYHFYHITL